MKLEKYLLKVKLNPYQFADVAGLSFSTIYNVLRGKDMYLSVAAKIIKASENKVRVADLLNENSMVKRTRKKKWPKAEQSQ